jgi:hypothetical protein
VAALKYYHPDDLQSVEMRNIIAGDGVKGLLCKVSQLPPGDPLITEVEQAWAAWRL